MTPRLDAPVWSAWSPRRTTGDAELAVQVMRAAGAPGNHHSLAVAHITREAVRFAGLGTERGDGSAPVSEQTRFEAGSLAKPLTGMLLAQLAADGLVALEVPVADLLPGLAFTHPPAAQVTFAELAGHRSGLPRLHATSVPGTLRGLYRLARGLDPYDGLDTRTFLTLATRTPPTGPRGTFAYSNLGMALLGHALAAHAGTPGGYPTLLEQHILTPLDMRHTRTYERAEQLPPDRARPHGRGGARPVHPWFSRGYAPSGTGLWTTARDLARLLLAVLEDRAPGQSAALPRYPAEEPNRIGFGWFTLTRDGRETTWHNGATAGTRTFIGIDQNTGHAIAVLSNTNHDVDALGARLLDTVA